MQHKALFSFNILSLSASKHNKVSQRQELPPTLLSELYVNLSIHTAPIIQPLTPVLVSSEQIVVALVFSRAPTNFLPAVYDLGAFCISSSPSVSGNALYFSVSGTWLTCNSLHNNLPNLAHRR